MDITGRVLTTWLLITLALPVSAEVYRHVDSDGSVTFSDEPRDGAEEVEVKPVTTITLPKMKDVVADEERGANQRSRQTDDPSPYETIRFTSPGNNEAFHSGSGDIEFSVTSSPALRQGHKYEVSLDGQIVGQSAGGSVSVQNVFRGTHEASVAVVDSEGRPIQKGESITFTIHRPSVLN